MVSVSPDAKQRANSSEILSRFAVAECVSYRRVLCSGLK